MIVQKSFKIRKKIYSVIFFNKIPIGAGKSNIKIICYKINNSNLIGKKTDS